MMDGWGDGTIHGTINKEMGGLTAAAQAMSLRERRSTKSESWGISVTLIPRSSRAVVTSKSAGSMSWAAARAMLPARRRTDEARMVARHNPAL
jgi:hypothetical protein